MRSPHLRLAIALSACSLPLGNLSYRTPLSHPPTDPGIGTAAQECPTSSTGSILHVTSPDQLAALEGCTTLTGDISIESDFSGEFILHGVTELKGAISAPARLTGLGRLELPDLVEVGDIFFSGGLPADVALPSLERAGSIDLYQTELSGEVDLGALSEAENINLRGSWTSINLASLKTVVKDIQFCGGLWCGDVNEEDPRDEGDFPWLSIDLPSLEKTDYFDLQGKIKSVSVPNLEVVGYIPPTELVHSQGLRMSITATGELLDFDGPKLHTLNGSLQVYGSINSLSLGALGDTTVGATFNARGPLKIYSTIKTASHFYLWVDLESIWLPNMVDLGTVSLSIQHRLPCNDTLYQLWETQSENSSDWEDYNTCLDYDYPHDGEDPGNPPTPTPTPSSTPIPTPTSTTRPTPGNEDDDDDDDTTDESGDDGPVDEGEDVDDTNDTNDESTSSTSGDSGDDESYAPGNAAGALLLPATGGLVIMIIAVVSASLF
ncbi:hypothetical protein BJX64DRAFT_68350 [Aspergillus heterothallicus]